MKHISDGGGRTRAKGMGGMDWFSSLSLPSVDGLAVILLFACWYWIGWRTEHPPAGRPSVSILMQDYRREWMRQFVAREPRIFDANILQSLREGTSFFASATMIAIGGGLALIGNHDRLSGIAREFDVVAPGPGLELKIMLALFFVIDAFLKFVWSHRLFGYCAITMASVPNDAGDPVAMTRAEQAADLNITAARSFNAGLRNVYFAIAALAWLGGPWALMVAASGVTAISWRREFASHSRRVIARAVPPHHPAP